MVVACSKGYGIWVLEIDPQGNILVIPIPQNIELFSVQSRYFSVFPMNSDGLLSYFLYAGSLGEMDDCSQIIGRMNFYARDLISFYGVYRWRPKELFRRELNWLPQMVNCLFLGLIPKTEVWKWLA